MTSNTFAALVMGFALTATASSMLAAPQGVAETAPTYMNAVVVSTDVGASTVTVRAKGKGPETLRLEGALAARLGELKPGDAVIVTLRSGRVMDVRLATGPRPGPLTPSLVPPVPTPPAPPTLYPGPAASPGPAISPTPEATPTPTPDPWRTPPPVPTPRPVPTPKRVFPSPEFTVPPSPGPSPTPTPSPG